LFAHDVVAVGIEKVVDNGDLLVGMGLGGDAGIVRYDLGVKNLLVDRLAEVVRLRAGIHPCTFDIHTER
jgi:hypothetical protein